MTNEEMNRQIDLANRRNVLRGQICDLREKRMALPDTAKLAKLYENLSEDYALRGELAAAERELAELGAPQSIYPSTEDYPSYQDWQAEHDRRRNAEIAKTTAEILYSEVFDSHAAFIGPEYLGSYKTDADAAAVINEAYPHIQVIRAPL